MFKLARKHFVKAIKPSSTSQIAATLLLFITHSNTYPLILFLILRLRAPHRNTITTAAMTKPELEIDLTNMNDFEPWCWRCCKVCNIELPIPY
jgi:hypothetical protein